jgi:phosphoenolpyruvate carboxylase
LNDASELKSLEKDFIDYAYHSAELKLPSNSALKLVAEPGMSADEFRTQCTEVARKERDAAATKLKQQYKKKMTAVQKKLTKEERELAQDETELSARKMEEMATHAENVFGLFTGSRRRVTTSLTKRRMTAQAKADVEESVEAIAAFKQELEALEAQMAEELDDINEHWEDIADDIEETTLKPLKKNVRVDIFSVAWFPHWQVEAGGEVSELPAFGA